MRLHPKPVFQLKAEGSCPSFGIMEALGFGLGFGPVVLVPLLRVFRGREVLRVAIYAPYIP